LLVENLIYYFQDKNMNFKMWIKALQIIPRIDKVEWDKLDVISRWLIATRAAVLIMTFISAAIAGLLAALAGQYHWGRWVLLAVGLIFAHATNNLLNDLTDSRRGVDKDNYFRTQYGPQPVEQGLMTTRQLLTYAAVTGLIALAAGIPLVIQGGWVAAALLAAGVVFVLFYTWPLKYIGLGEITVILVWGPLMIGGGYFVITGKWDWNVVIASLPYALGVTTVIFGKHIDKLPEDKVKNIHTLPVILGEKTARYTLLGMMAFQYLLVVYLVVIHYFSPVMLVVFLGLIDVVPKVLPIFLHSKPAECPEKYRKDVWPLWYVAAAFYQNRIYGMIFILALIVELVLGKIWPGWW
jgi:1,4-dihydroxy-2-naphthoate polyprenyltransferase